MLKEDMRMDYEISCKDMDYIKNMINLTSLELN